MEKLKEFKKVTFILVDIVLINFSYLLALLFRFSMKIPGNELNNYYKNLVVITLIYILIFQLFKLYDNLWTYAGIDEFMLVVGGCIAANLLSTVYCLVINSRIPFGVCLLAGFLNVMFIGGFRISFRINRRIKALIRQRKSKTRQRVMIVGAGAAGAMIIKEMKSHSEMNYKPVAVIDDNKFKVGTSLSGIKVMGDRYDIEKIASEKDIDVILLSIPSIDTKNRKEIIDICKKTNCKLKTIPGMYEIIDGKVSLSKVRNVDYEELLGREPVKLDMSGISGYIKDRVILVTGGGGSIGSELCRQIAKFGPKQVIILDNYENGVYDLQMEFRYKNIELNMTAVIASITDRITLEEVFKKYKPELVFHAAAHKHVPLMEGNPIESIKNNVFGTLNLAEFADKYKVKRFVMISTDKAVNPTNIMGATKRACEMIVQAMDKKSETEFVSVRFGNVLGSNGSVIPLFKKQIANGGPVTVTHPEINRFFMTIPEAAQLVLQAGAFAKGGEIFVLDMENPVKIYDLAKDLIKLSGFEPNKDIKIEFVGLRPGEKLYEEVLTDEEGLNQTSHNKIFIGKASSVEMGELNKELNELNEIVESNDLDGAIKKMVHIVPTYSPSYNKTSNEEAAVAK